MTRSAAFLPVPFLLALVLVSVLAICAQAEDNIDFETQVQPILADHCYGCHGPEKQESNYRLDIRDRALGQGDHGEPAILPGSAADSTLIRFVSRDDEDLAMPPEGEGKALSPAQVAVLRRWIDAGAIWPDELAGDPEEAITTDHWSFQPLRPVTPPPPQNDWPQNEIDQFVSHQLHERGLSPSVPADPVTLIRRVYLDMHGLPPTWRQVQEFLADGSTTSYRRIVEQTLASTHYGERWARHWLDVARFGESTGYEVNRDRENAYHFRDYVIGALNADKSYRDFIVEQLAGDVVGADVGTGFLVGGPNDLVKSPDKNLTLMQRQDELADYVNTTATAFLGLTVGCARCHNHKFDPILQKDYYAMQAVFAGIQHGEREIADTNTQQVKDHIARLETEQKKLEVSLAELRTQAPVPESVGKEEPVNFQRNVEVFEPIEAKFVRFFIKATTGAEPCIDELEVFSTDGKNVALATNGTTATASGTLPGYKIHQLEHIHDGQFGNSHSWISNTPGGGWVQLEFAESRQISRIQWGRDRTGVVRDRLATRYVIAAAMSLDTLQIVSSSDRRKPFSNADEPEDAFISRLPREDAIVATKVLNELKRTRDKVRLLRESIPKAYIGTFKTPETIHRLYRGEPLAPREVVLPDALSVLDSLGLTNETPEQERRLTFAKWVASPDNPLTARVIVNRVWHYHFGTGLVSTPSDFGKNGTEPSHPELLDWLAWNFMQNDWSLKWLHRKILLSATYQQSSTPRREELTKDAESRYLWRFPPRRLEAEAIRDCILQVAGSLEHRGGGPGFLLLEIDHENVHHYFPKKELGPAEFRRMIYMTKIRQEQDAVFGVFDCPDGGQVIPDRSRSTTPLQALNLLNSPFVLQQSGLLADRVRKEASGNPAEQVKLVFQRAFSRAPTAGEQQGALQLIDGYGLESLCRVIFNSNEFLFLP